MPFASMSGLVDDGGDSCSVLNVDIFVEWRFLDVGPGTRIYGSSAVARVDNDLIGTIAEDRA